MKNREKPKFKKIETEKPKLERKIIWKKNSQEILLEKENLKDFLEKNNLKKEDFERLLENFSEIDEIFKKSKLSELSKEIIFLRKKKEFSEGEVKDKKFSVKINFLDPRTRIEKEKGKEIETFSSLYCLFCFDCSEYLDNFDFFEKLTKETKFENLEKEIPKEIEEFRETLFKSAIHLNGFLNSLSLQKYSSILNLLLKKETKARVSGVLGKLTELQRKYGISQMKEIFKNQKSKRFFYEDLAGLAQCYLTFEILGENEAKKQLENKLKRIFNYSFLNPKGVFNEILEFLRKTKTEREILERKIIEREILVPEMTLSQRKKVLEILAPERKKEIENISDEKEMKEFLQGLIEKGKRKRDFEKAMEKLEI